MKLNKTETELLLAIITGSISRDFAKMQGKRYDEAINSLKEKGFIRVNQRGILELNLSDSYLKQIGY
ncbi:hypothetical protein [Bacteroides stercorirosoris]|jgi:hypothetical protein|uniref:hypothetical protein n=1 Tax=Bacteroides stercorirosoris TaxID=871324 RepID=UPI00047230F5|nr:hypothetical protein [Bacteroides stercorirosoris]OKZ14455.1 MAG: hypothetical protein BHV75_01140 [Bacteroides oleiciplenus]